jgi:hypothetical protein
MKFNCADFSVEREIDRRVDLEAWKQWAAKPTPAFTPLPDETDYAAPVPPITALYNFVVGLRP